MKGIELEAGKRYQINGREYDVVIELEVGPGAAQYTARRFTIQGKRGAIRGVDIRLNGSDWTWGWKSGQIEEIRSCQPL